ncbi:hypothetical protein ATN81_11675 [Agrobacterium pusense]|uniref:hypothetical protein n=1 Tax=Agrobacterium pusense TaxID=648995 RepID=UPI0009280D55|nr:hypothetical protein [Agrobacterium pusense]OJH54911.1 hypothetical protein ATN81_11675 [Agrobacterium pusense]OJH59263.1 hypothetical protein BA725_13270 [Agrobacterium pusense]
MDRYYKAILLLSVCFTLAFHGRYAAAASDEECAAIGRIAERVMQGRQDGVSLQSTLDVLIPKNKEEIDPGFRKMIMDAYEAPNFHTQEGKERAIGEFRDQYQLKCMKG